jgi:hypothetical protein
MNELVRASNQSQHGGAEKNPCPCWESNPGIQPTAVTLPIKLSLLFSYKSKIHSTGYKNYTVLDLEEK